MGTCQTAARQGKLQGVNRDHFHSKFLLFIDWFSYQYWFWSGFIASLVTPDHHFVQDASYLWFKLPHLHVLRPGARLRNKVQPTTVMKLLWDFAYVPKGSYRWELHRLFWLFICNVPLNLQPEFHVLWIAMTDSLTCLAHVALWPVWVKRQWLWWKPSLPRRSLSLYWWMLWLPWRMLWLLKQTLWLYYSREVRTLPSLSVCAQPCSTYLAFVNFSCSCISACVYTIFTKLRRANGDSICKHTWNS